MYNILRLSWYFAEDVSFFSASLITYSIVRSIYISFVSDQEICYFDISLFCCFVKRSSSLLFIQVKIFVFLLLIRNTWWDIFTKRRQNLINTDIKRSRWNILIQRLQRRLNTLYIRKRHMFRMLQPLCESIEKQTKSRLPQA